MVKERDRAALELRRLEATKLFEARKGLSDVAQLLKVRRLGPGVATPQAGRFRDFAAQ